MTAEFVASDRRQARSRAAAARAELDRLWARGRAFLGSDLAIMGGAMTWVSERNLVAAISNAGGFGVIASGSMTPDLLDAEIAATAALTGRQFGVNIITMHPRLFDLIDVCLARDVGHVVLAGGIPPSAAIARIRDGGAHAVCFAPALVIAKKLVRSGAEAIVIEGSEAGGHIGPVSTAVLAQEVLPHVTEVPVFVAGGIGRGEAILSYLEMGASGVQLGTRFVCAYESVAHANFKRAFIRAASRDAVPSVQLDTRFPVIPVRALAEPGDRAVRDDPARGHRALCPRRAVAKGRAARNRAFLGGRVAARGDRRRHRGWVADGRAKRRPRNVRAGHGGHPRRARRSGIGPDRGTPGSRRADAGPGRMNDTAASAPAHKPAASPIGPPVISSVTGSQPGGGGGAGTRRLLRQLRDVMAALGTAQERLDRIVRIVAAEMVAEVCSAYVMRAGEVLELFATEGLRREAVHRTRLRVGEGLVGVIAATARPLALADAQAHPDFAYRPETGEEIYHSLMGVPVLRGGRVLGVLVVQNRTLRHYSEDESEVLQTIAMIVAELIASGELVNPLEMSQSDSGALLPLRLDGIRLNEGLAIGPAVLHAPTQVHRQDVAEDDGAELQRLRRAVVAMQSQVDELVATSRRLGAGEHRDIIETYRMFAADRGWVRRIAEAVRSGLTAEAAVQKIREENRTRMLQIADPYLRERLLDLEDLANRLQTSLSGGTGRPISASCRLNSS